MFPIRLSYFLAAEHESCSRDAVQALLAGLDWGDEAGLMARSDEWAGAVVLIKDWKDVPPGIRCDYPTEINFVHFPGRVKGNDADALVIKLALLRMLAAAFECRVICDAADYIRAEEGIPKFGKEESFLCQHGRVFSASTNVQLISEGYRTRAGWVALEGLPDAKLASDGRLVDADAASGSLAGWMAVRDQTHLHNTDRFDLLHPKPPPLEPREDRPPATEEEIEAEMAEEFPTDEELDEEEREMEEEFKRLNAWERGFGTTAGKQLLEEGVSLPPPDELDDAELTKKLWQVVNLLGEKHTYLHSTDHLTDRELYSWLWQEGLSENIMSAAGLSDAGSHIDILGSGSEESIRLGLIYYDDAEKRADWFASWPDNPIPAHLDRVSDRDRHLPQRES